MRRSTGLGPVWPPFEGSQVTGVDHDPGQIQSPGGAQLGEEVFVHVLPDAGLVPLGQPPPAGGAGRAEQAGR